MEPAELTVPDTLLAVDTSSLKGALKSRTSAKL